MAGSLLNSTSTVTRVASYAVIGSISQIGTGVTTRFAGSMLTNGFDVEKSAKEAFNLQNILMDGAIGGVFGGVQGGLTKPQAFTSSQVQKVNSAGEGGSEVGELKSFSKPSSKALRQNLIDVGIEVPDYPNAAHHIVAGNSPKAAEAREILRKYGVDINDAVNGTFLPTVKDVSQSTYHPSLHTNVYYERINEALRKATSKEDVLVILNDIREQLLDGTFMNWN